MESGYLVALETLGPKAARMTDFAVSQSAPIQAFASSSLPMPLKSVANIEPASTGMDTVNRSVQALAQSADSFEGKRSLATARMFLFDIVERMFVRKMPELANHLRDGLREARDRPAMMCVARDIILNVEEIAGPDRADGLSERLAMMLPPEHY
ncbi:MAG: hypothetical protein H7197_10060 [Vitreoscilla sp.]|nr:hypothetical protein [Polaromonas sp.]